MNREAFVDQLKQPFWRLDRRRPTSRISIPGSRYAPKRSRRDLPIHLRDEPDLRFDFLNCISGVDYFQPDQKKAKKADWEPHLEVVYHLFSMTHKHSLVLKVMLSALERRHRGRVARSPERGRVSGGRPTGTSVRSTIFAACGSPAIPTCGASSAPKIGSAIRCGKTTKCRSSITGFEAVRIRR